MKAIPEVLIVLGLIGAVAVTGYLNFIIGIYTLNALFIGAGIFLARVRR
jgi:hypothetical protein